MEGYQARLILRAHVTKALDYRTVSRDRPASLIREGMVHYELNQQRLAQIALFRMLHLIAPAPEFGTGEQDIVFNDACAALGNPVRDDAAYLQSLLPEGETLL